MRTARPPALSPRQKETVKAIFGLVEFSTGVSIKDFRGRSSTREISHARWLAMYCIDECTNLSLVAIGSLFDRDHTTVMNALSKVETSRHTDAELNDLIRGICRKCGPHSQVNDDVVKIAELEKILAETQSQLQKCADILKTLRN
jgi:hypothetical protein